MSAKNDRDRAVRRKIDEVVGTDYDAPRVRGLRGWLRERWPKWLLGAVFAVAAMSLVAYTIESHLLPRSVPVPVPVKKPVPVQILPAR